MNCSGLGSIRASLLDVQIEFDHYAGTEDIDL